MNIRKILVCILLMISYQSFAQKKYILDLSPDKWTFSSSVFYISDVIDERDEKKDAGQVLNDGKLTRAGFSHSLEEDITPLIAESMLADSSKLPLVMVFKKFILNETGALSNHKATLDFSIVLYRIHKGRRYQLYQAGGKPEVNIRGAYPYVHENNIKQSIRKVIENFNEWVSKRDDLALLARSVKISFDKTKSASNLAGRDTIIWNKDYRLSWSDFHGKPNTSPYMALSNCVFNYSGDPLVKNGVLELNMKMIACFDKKASWVKQDQMKDDLLAHEQLHFDICELNIRKLRMKLAVAELDPMEFDSQIKNLFDEAWNKYQVQQQAYDDETEHGLVREKQLDWQKNISNELSSLKE